MYVKRFGVNTEGRDIAVGDVHGHFSYLQVELDRIKFNPLIDRLFIVGDLVDRGPENREAFNWLNKDWVFSVKGNHDDHVSRYLTSPSWLENAGSWFKAFTPQEQELFSVPFDALPIALEVETKYGLVGIVHAGCAYDSWDELVARLRDDSRRKEHKKVMNKCMYSRARFEEKDTTRITGVRALVVGHNPVTDMLKLGNTYYIDTEGWKPGRGKFTLLNLNGLQVM